ncbi:uncharacterized protein LOC105697141 isoform X2 [Orussus abietinus]|uniref:uncharacterized protein LOC105697141 isoform X2 n=1 Tax=Orussus abietinus TaxID=222816 RepID=UPI000625F8CE|nr:uncharacterized protein LOC105697141 isoform X2 [Orussus abietinus]
MNCVTLLMLYIGFVTSVTNINTPVKWHRVKRVHPVQRKADVNWENGDVTNNLHDIRGSSKTNEYIDDIKDKPEEIFQNRPWFRRRRSSLSTIRPSGTSSGTPSHKSNYAKATKNVKHAMPKKSVNKEYYLKKSARERCFKKPSQFKLEKKIQEKSSNTRISNTGGKGSKAYHSDIHAIESKT